MSNLREYKCPSCGGPLAFDVSLQKLKCPYCDNAYAVNEMENSGAGNNKGADNQVQTEIMAWMMDEQSALRMYSCNSCGGEIIADITTGATSCPYCNNPVVMVGHFSGRLRPDSIIPFKLDKNSAIEALKEHYKGKPFLPTVFKKKNHLQEIKGVYVPFWMFSGKADGKISFNTSRIRKWSDYSFYYTEESIYRVEAKGDISYENIPIDASTKMPDDLMDSLEPYNMKDAVSFNTAYMAGYLADKFDVDMEKCLERAKWLMVNTTGSEFISVKGYDSSKAVDSNIRFIGVSAKYTLLPVWLLITKWNNMTYTYAMNGQTGKFIGELPEDAWKKRAIKAAITIGIGTFLYQMCMLIGGILL